jgi:hypothetical protein
LTGYDFNVNYDSAILSVDNYIIGSGLGDLDSGEAEDWSGGDNGMGSINLAEVFYLMGFSFQKDSFALATGSFIGESLGNSILTFSDVILGDSLGDPISATSENANINVVPVASSALHLFSGLLGLAGLRRKFRSEPTYPPCSCCLQ